MRHLAWLNAVPKPDERSRRAKGDLSKIPSRIEAMRRSGIKPPMPPNPSPQITAWLMEIGINETAGMGVATISWREIDAWRSATGIDLGTWGARLIRKLSAAYVAEGRAAESEGAPPPWRAPVTKREVDTELSRLQMLLG